MNLLISGEVAVWKQLDCPGLHALTGVTKLVTLLTTQTNTVPIYDVYIYIIICIYTYIYNIYVRSQYVTLQHYRIFLWYVRVEKINFSHGSLEQLLVTLKLQRIDLQGMEIGLETALNS